jgi:hypothetical protein
MRKPNVLFVGDHHRPEFSDAVNMLRRQTKCVWSADTRSAMTSINHHPAPPDVVVIGQARPGQYSAAEIDRLRRELPLARFLALLGSLCEGEARTGQPWPGVVRIYWHQWAPRFARELERLSAGICPTWGLPLTATPDEMIDFSTADARRSRTGLLAIRARLAGTYDALAAACRATGYATVWLRDDLQVRVEGPVAVVWDDNHCDHPQAARIGAVAEAVRPAPVVVLLHFPRAGDRERALGAGAAAILSKPLLLDDLCWQLDRLTDSRPAAAGVVE